MNELILVLVLVIIGYVFGSFPSGVIISKAFFGFDIRTKGSGNMGSTNVFRVLGKKWGALVQLLDLLKGYLPVFLVPIIIINISSIFEFNLNLSIDNSIQNITSTNTDLNILSTYIDNDKLVLLKLITGISAVLGHVFSFFVSFKGGKGINTAVGMMLAIAPIDVLIIFTAFLIILFTTGYVSLGSIVGAILLPLSLFLRQNFLNVEIQGYTTILSFALFLTILVIYTHRSNVNRLIKGEESSFENLKLINKINKK